MGLAKRQETGFVACAFARDIQSFDLLIEDMEAEVGEAWGGLDYQNGARFLQSAEGQALEFITIAVDRKDEENLDPVLEVIKIAGSVGVKVILVAHDLTPVALHQLLRSGADDFAPYPLPEGALKEAIDRLREPPQPQFTDTSHGSHEDRNGAVIPVYGIAGGVGATTFAVNLAWELALLTADKGIKICILDLDLQCGSVSTYLDLPRREAVFELISDTEAMDRQSFSDAMLSFNDKVDVLTAPADALPLEMLEPPDLDRLLAQASAQYDFVILDLPKTLVQWTETIFNRADLYFALLEMDMRSAQNAIRFIRALKAEDLPFEKVRYVLNHAPKFTDLQGKARAKRMAENLGIELDMQLPDGTRQVTDSCDHGLPLAETMPKNPLRKEIAKMAQTLVDLATEAVAKK